MKSFFLILLLSLLGIMQIQAQQVGYTYDLSGNITSRKVIPFSTRSSIDSTTISRRSFEDKEINVKIYPNPTKGILRISIDNLDVQENMAVLLYDLSGRLLINTKREGSEIELDLSSYQNGTYILRLIRNNEKSEWKIIKTN